MSNVIAPPYRRLAMLNSLRVRPIHDTPGSVVETPVGPVATSVHEKVLHLLEHGHVAELANIAAEANVLAAFVSEMLLSCKPLSPYTGKFKIPEDSKPEVETVEGNCKLHVVAEAFGIGDAFKAALAKKDQLLGQFGLCNFPAWTQEYLHTDDIRVLRALTKEQSADQRFNVCAQLYSVTGTKVVWTFVSNPGKVGSAYLSPDHAGLMQKGEYWLLRHNGGTDLDSEIIGGVRMEKERCEELAATLSKVWKRFN